MHIHHFFPQTRNIGDYFVQRGIATIVKSVVPDVSFEHFDVNSRGHNKTEYGLSKTSVERANREADLVIIGGSNLYEGAFGWPWGVALDTYALERLDRPLFLMGIGTGSSFDSPLHVPTKRAVQEIKLLNKAAKLSWARDLVTVDWLNKIGVTNAEMLGDPATGLFRSPLKNSSDGDYVLVVIPPTRIRKSKRGAWKANRFGRAIFQSLVDLVRNLLERKVEVTVACNDPADLPLAQKMFSGWFSGQMVCPEDADKYFALVSRSRAVVSGRLHTAAVALSLAKPFVLFNLDYRTEGYIQTYQLNHAVVSHRSNLPESLFRQTDDLLLSRNKEAWTKSILIRDELYQRAQNRLASVFKSIRLLS